MSTKQYLKGKKKSIAGFAALTFALSMSLSGTSVNAATSGPHAGGTMYYITQAKQLNHLDPQRIYTGQDIAFANTYLYRTLVAWTPAVGQAGLTLIPDLATNTGVPSNGGKTWSWTIKSGIKWQDGSPLTCADEKYALSRTFATDVITDGPSYLLQDLDIPADAKGNPMYLGPYKKTGQAYFDKAVTCNGMTITLKLNKPVGDFNNFATYPAMSPVKQSADTGAAYDNAPWALGPYKIKEYKIGTDLTLVRNPQWSKATDTWRTPYPDQVVMRFGISEDVRDQIFLTDSTKNAVNYDQGLQPTNNVAFFNGATKSRGTNTASPYVRYYAVNVAPGHLDCLDIRKAVFFAINTKALIDLAGGPQFYGNPGDGVIAPLLATDFAPTKGNIHDPNWKVDGNSTYAASLMAQAKTSCPATYARATDPNKGLVFDISNTATNKKGSALIQTALNAAGIQVTFNFLEPGTYYSYVQDPTKEDDIATSGWAADWPNASTVIPDLYTKNGGFDLTQNWTDPAYPAFEAKVFAAQAETNRAKQAADWKALNQYAMDQYWTLRPIFNLEQNQWGSGIGGAAFWLPQGSLLFPKMYVK